MKKMIYLFATAALLTACSGGNNKGYTVTGTVEGAADGEMVYIGNLVKREFIKLDSATIQNGTFLFRGVQDTAAYRALSYQALGNSIETYFFLENGNINANMTKENPTVTGTTNNDIYQAYKSQDSELFRQMRAAYDSMSDTTLTDEQRRAKAQELENLEERQLTLTKESIGKNIANPVGVLLLKQNYYYMELEELDTLLAQIPAEYENDETIIRIKENVEKLKATAVGKQFTDFEMQTPEGNPVKLSDYVGKGKVVLVDFWASWCGPCRREMPNLVEAYAQFKGKNFEIVGVSLDRDAEAWKKAIKDLNITWPQMSDIKFWDCEGARLYAVSSIPHTVLIDGDGIILARGLHGEDLQKKLAEVLQ